MVASFRPSSPYSTAPGSFHKHFFFPPGLSKRTCSAWTFPCRSLIFQTADGLPSRLLLSSSLLPCPRGFSNKSAIERPSISTTSSVVHLAWHVSSTRPFAPSVTLKLGLTSPCPLACPGWGQRAT